MQKILKVESRLRLNLSHVCVLVVFFVLYFEPLSVLVPTVTYQNIFTVYIYTIISIYRFVYKHLLFRFILFAFFISCFSSSSNDFDELIYASLT